MSQPVAGEEESGKPSSILAIYLWDSVLAMLGILGALVPFAGGVLLGGLQIDLPLWAQVLLAFQGATYAASVIIVMIFLTRRFVWVRVVQMLVLGVASALAVVSLAVEQLTHHDVSSDSLPGYAFVVLVNITVIFLLTAPKLRAWYSAPGKAPVWVRATVALWIAGAVAQIVTYALA